MYNPLWPNVYRDVKIATRKRQRAAASASSDFLADALASLGGEVSAGGGLSRSPTARNEEITPMPLTASAEELHQQRVSRSAAMGITTAVTMEKNALLVEHTRRKLEGSDAKSRIAGMLSRMRGAQAPPLVGGKREASQTTGDSSSGTTAPSAPLVFQRSPLAAGGYVMTAATECSAVPGLGTSGALVAAPPTLGKPSSTLLLRWSRRCPLPPELAAGSFGELAAQLGNQARAECSRYGVVRSSATHFLTPLEEQRVRETVQSKGINDDVEDVVAHERCRVLVRFDTVTDAFKAAEALRRTQNWSVSFFPTASYDSGSCGPSDGEPPCA